jgi:DNA-binding MarR family transcriptional regulator
MAQREHSNSRRQKRAIELEAALATLYFVARRDYSIDLSHRAIRVLQLVAFADQAPRMDDVAHHLGCAASTASELVKRLHSKGLLVRRRSEQDERVVRLELADAGQVALTEHTSLDPKKLETGLEALSVSDQKELVRITRALAEAL